MSFQSFLEKITTPRSPDNVLVCQATFNGLRAVIVDKKGEKLTVGQEASSSLHDLDEAVEEVIKKVRENGWKGQYAILVTPAVCMTVLDLSIPANSKLPVSQVAESIQWELEPSYNQHKNILVIGQLLQLAGYLSTEQVDEVLQKQNELINSKSSTVVYKRFGELAVEAGFLAQKQIDDALTRQKWFVSEGEDLKCGWHPLQHQPMADVSDYKWLAVGVKLDILRAWQAAFSKQEVKLEALFPEAGTGMQGKQDGLNTGLAIKNTQELVLELHQGAMSAAFMVNEEPMQMQTMASADGIVLANIGELVSTFSQSDGIPTRVIDCLGTNKQQSDQLHADIEAILDRSVQRAEIPSGKINLPMRNAIKKFFRVNEAGYVEGVSVYEPLPNVMQRFSARAILAGLLILGLILLTEVAVFASDYWFKTGIASISEDVNKIREEKKRINTKIKTVEKLNKDIKQKEAEKKNATTMIALLTKELPERNQMLVQLMTDLQESVTEDIVVNTITEDTLLGFNFQAWALTDQAAQTFVKKFQLAIHPKSFRVKNLTVNEQTGRLGLIGYSVNFSITPYSEAEWKRRRGLKRGSRY